MTALRGPFSFRGACSCTAHTSPNLLPLAVASRPGQKGEVEERMSTPDHLQQLLLVRQLAREADRHLLARSDFDNGLAVSLMQDAVELMLWTACKQHGVNLTDKASFDSMIEKLCDPALSLGP